LFANDAVCFSEVSPPLRAVLFIDYDAPLCKYPRKPWGEHAKLRCISDATCSGDSGALRQERYAEASVTSPPYYFIRLFSKQTEQIMKKK